MTEPSKTAQYLTETKRLSEAVDAYRAERGSEPKPVPTKPKWPPPLATPTEIEGFPLNHTPPTEVPDYGNMGRVAAIKHRQRKVGGATAIEALWGT